MAELQIPNYMTNRPESIADLAEAAMRMQANQQQQRLNDMKIAEAEQLAPAKRQLYEAQAQDEATTAMLRKQKVLGTLANNVLGQLNKSGIQDQNQRNAFIKQAIDAHKPYLQGALGLPVNEYIDEQQLQSLASSATSDGHNKFSIHPGTGLMVDLTTGEAKEIVDPATGRRVEDPRYSTNVEYSMGIAKSIPQLVKEGHLSIEDADAIMSRRRGGKPQQSIPTANWTPEYERQLIARANQGDQDAINEIESTANGGAYNPIPTATQRKQAESEIEQQSKIPEREQHQATQYQAQSKPFRELSEAYQKTKTLFDKAKDSAPATLAAATAYMKLLDPGSVVRESELGMALAATGKLDKASNFMNEIKNGKVLTDSQIKEFKAAVEDVYKASKSQQLKLDKHYKETAERKKLNPKNIIQDVGQYGDYKSADELKAAVANGQLDIEEAKDIARMKFGME
jgi:hypothetical protein